MPAPRRYRIPARMPSKSVVAQLSESLCLSLDPPVAVQRDYLDTADWLLYAEGLTLEADTTAHGVHLTLRAKDSEHQVATATVDRAPHFAPDLPAHPVWAPAATAAGDRRLLPRVRLDARLQPAAVLDGEQKTTARVLLERFLLEDGSGRRRILRAATVLPVRGYERSADRVAQTLERAGLHLHDTPLLPLALRLLRQPAPGAALGPGVPLKRSMTAAQAMHAVLTRLHHHVMSNEEGVRLQYDREFLHDYRVAIRRARSMLKRAGQALPEEPAQALAEELRWLAGLTSPVRDLDVYLEELTGDQNDQDDLEPLREYLSARQSEAHVELLKGLDSDRYRRLLEEWGRLETAGEGLSGAEPAGRFADECIARAYRRVLKRGRAITDESPPESLHDLRKRAKELRYLLECFQTLYPEQERVAVVRELKALQDNLGEFQDCQVQAATLRAMAEDLVQDRAAPAATLMAMGRLADEQERREARARAEFGSRFARFAARDNRRRLAAMVAGDR